MKKGQVTVFIILGIVILLVIAGVIFLLRTPVEEIENKNIEEINTNPITFFVENCVTKTTTNGVRDLGIQGGYYKVVPENAVKEFAFDIPRYSAKSNQKIISKEVFAQELSTYVHDHLGECIQHFNVFAKEYNIKELDDYSAEVEIVPKKMIVRLNYPLEISLGETTKSIDSFDTEIRMDLDRFLDLVYQSFLEVKKEPEYMPLGVLTQLAYTNDYQIENTNIDDDTVVYVYLFNPQLKDSEPFVFNYAVDYNWEGVFK